MDEATEQAIRKVLDMYVESGDVASYGITESGKIEARLTERGEGSIDFMGEFFDSFTEEELVMKDLAVGAQVTRTIRPQPMKPS